ncbi:hypothetical protein ACJMK2_040703 [Sinanodonta woodiana]|uniref:peptidylprolyl isomerase n=1 Tax=Sinanodonta woodiana TaxID=1069815 RepID=A0ABD3W1U5_SINWO
MGVTKEIIQAGSGPCPKKGQTVVVHYTGTLENGKKFDSSRDRGSQFEFKIGVGQVIKGWDEGVMTMKIGERAKLTISPDYGYGTTGVSGVYPLQIGVLTCSLTILTIPSNAVLIFDVELFGVK